MVEYQESLIGSTSLSAILIFLYKNKEKIKSKWRKIRRERTINLLILGEASAGKTSLIKILSDKKVSEADILNLNPTDAKKELEGLRIPHGRYEFIPKMTDVPRAKYDVKAELINQNVKRAIVYVVSFTKQRQRPGIDKSYLSEQKGALAAQLGFIEAGNKKKNVCFILFINKLDLLLEEKPEDTSSRDKVKQIEEVCFKEHIKLIENTSIPYKIIHGSCYKKWNTDKIMDIIIHKIKK